MSNAPSTETSTVFFGVHLVNTKVITFEQLKMAMAYQQYRNFKFGDEAVACGLLTEEQVKTALLLQRRKDIKIGEACIELKFLTQEQVLDVLSTQRTAHVHLGQALIATKALSADQLTQEQQHFQAATAEQLTLDAATDPAQMAQTAIETAAKVIPRLGGITAKVSDIRTGKFPQESGLSSWVGFKGSNTGFVGLRIPHAIANKVATYMLGMPTTDELTTDVLGEVVNTICGNLTGALATDGREYTLSTPTAGDFPPFSPQAHVVLTEFLCAEGPYYLVISTRNEK